MVLVKPVFFLLPSSNNLSNGLEPTTYLCVQSNSLAFTGLQIAPIRITSNFLVPSIPVAVLHNFKLSERKKNKKKKKKKTMASVLLQPSAVLSHSPSSSSSSLSFNHSINTPRIAKPLNLTSLRTSHVPTQRTTTSSPSQRFAQSKRNLIRGSTLDETYVLEAPPPPPTISELKLKLVNAVSGLNRGLAASEEDLRRADDAAKELEAAGGFVDLSDDLDKLQGRWRLIYSSAFSSRTLGGSRPGPPIGSLLPITLGQVFQRIDVISKDFDNIVELRLGTPWPLPPVELTATLAHKFELIGSAKIKIVYEKTSVKTRGSLSQLPPLEVPRLPDALRPPSNPGAGEFEVTYLDNDTRVTRGDKGELRVFLIS